MGKGMESLRWKMIPVLAVGLCLVGLETADGQEAERRLGWAFTTELSFVLTAGNSETNTLGSAATAEYVWPRAKLRFAGGATRTESTLTTSRAVGTPADFQVIEERRTTAENYNARTRGSYDLSQAFFLFGGASWQRNTFAGFDNRTILSAGAGNTWIDNGRTTFTTDYGFTYTVDDEVVEDPSAPDEFAGFRLAYVFGHQLTETTVFDSESIFDSSLKEGDDLRINSTNAITVAISELLALKTSLLLEFDNSPAIKAVDLETAAGVPTGEQVLLELEKLDATLSLALVFRF